MVEYHWWLCVCEIGWLGHTIGHTVKHGYSITNSVGPDFQTTKVSWHWWRVWSVREQRELLFMEFMCEKLDLHVYCMLTQTYSTEHDDR